MALLAEKVGMDALLHLCAPDAEPPRPAAMMVLAHPDDEIVGSASLLPALTLAAFVYLTDGSPRTLHDAEAAGCDTREQYACMRRGELLSALESVGIDAKRVEFVDGVDQEAYSQLVSLTLWLEILIREHSPEIILTHPYEGGHPDHDAAAFAVHAARRRIASVGDRAPVIAEFTSYHLGRASVADEPLPKMHGASRTIRSAAAEPSGDLGSTWEFGTFLPNADSRHVLTRRLAPDEITLKRRLIGCYASQRDVLRRVPLEVERYRVAPEYDFTRAPHEGRLLYEQFPWGITGAHWREQAGAALQALEGIATEPRNLMGGTVSGRTAIRT